MALEAPNLDDRRFQEIVNDAKGLITRYCPEWTNHNLSDPGVALIELFAWMTELTLFRINQIPDRMQVKFLELMGIEPFGPTAAETDLTFWMSGATTATVPAGTEVASETVPGAGSVVFATERDLHLVQPTLDACVTAGEDGRDVRDCWGDLEYERATVTCFPSNPLRPGDCLYLGFEESLGNLLIGLYINADDIQGIGVDPTNPPLQWQAWSGTTWVPVPVLTDQTGGLNRDGQVLLRVPAPHEQMPLANRSLHWLRVRLMEPQPGQPTYTTSPRLYGVTPSCHGGTVRAVHSRREPLEHLGRSDGRPGQSFMLSHAPVVAREQGETIQVITDSGSSPWTEVDDFGRSGPDDCHYTCDDTSGEIRFGPRIRYEDGLWRQHGAIPPTGAEILHTPYRHGGGEQGNLPAGSLRTLRTTIPFIDRVENLVPAVGGIDAESVANAVARGPLTLRSGKRAITVSDYEHLTLLAASRVARTRCLPPAGSGEPVRLLVVPRVGRPVDDLRLDDFVLDDDLLDEIRTSLDRHRMLGTTIEVAVPSYQGVTVAALVMAVAGHDPDAVRQRVLRALYEYVNPISGGPERTGWPFDTDLNASVVAQVVATVEGVDRVSEVVLFKADVRNQRREGEGLEVVRLEEDSLFLSFRHKVVVR